MIPPWAVAIIIILFIITLLSSYYIFKKRLSKRRAVGTVRQDEKYPDILEKAPTTEKEPTNACHFADKMELDSEDPYYKGNFVTIDLEKPQQPQKKTTATPPPLSRLFPEDSNQIINKQVCEQPEAAARQAIRSASRKSRTRSMIVTDESSVFTNKVPDISTYATLRVTPHPTFHKPMDRNPQEPLENLFVRPKEEEPLEKNLFTRPSDTASIASEQTAIREATLHRNDVGTIRRMLQSSWSGNQLKASESSSTLSSGSIRPMASPVGSFNPRLQNQHLVSLSLRVPVRQRPSIIGYMEAPAPTTSFSSSTTRTMIPTKEEAPH
ncbi:hypothetical protein G6F56_003374 [Rhizopus delemar]|nr:hypothetical protein G6F56_003374 [Rhizopus delemar]